LGLTFFGLTTNNVSQVRFNLFSQIHEIVFFGKGGYTWENVYSLPIPIRRFVFSQIKKFYEEEKKQYESQSGTTNLLDSSGKPRKIPPPPKISPPNYITKPSNKK